MYAISPVTKFLTKTLTTPSWPESLVRLVARLVNATKIPLREIVAVPTGKFANSPVAVVPTSRTSPVTRSHTTFEDVGSGWTSGPASNRT